MSSTFSSTSDSEPFDAGETLEIEPRSPAEIATRVAVLKAVCQRAALELDHDSELDSHELSALRFDIVMPVVTPGYAVSIIPRERALLTDPVGTIDTATAIDATWEIEALSAIATTFDRLDQSLFSLAEANATSVMQAFDTEQSFETSGGQHFSLPVDRLAQLREQSEIWLWRLGLELEIRDGTDTEEPSLLHILEEVVTEGLTAGIIDRPAADILLDVDGSLSAQSAERLDSSIVAAKRRLIAMNWLCGFGEDWDSVPLEV